MRCSLVLVALVSTLSAGPISDTERQQLLDHLKNSQKVYAAAIRGLSPAQANFKSAPDRWSILECAEHLAQAEQLLFTEVTNALNSVAGKKSQASDENVLDVWGTSKQKAKSSGDYDPIGRWPDLATIQKVFDARRAKTIEFVTSTQEDLRGRLCCGGMDLYQQLLGISAHTLRHVEQMNQVKAQPGYPKS